MQCSANLRGAQTASQQKDSAVALCSRGTVERSSVGHRIQEVYFVRGRGNFDITANRPTLSGTATC